MTIPLERTWAVLNTEEFLYSLLDLKKTPKVPKEVRIKARELLKHYPSEYYLAIAAKKAPESFGK